MSVEIQCPACGEEAFLLREPQYDGLKKTGEKLACSTCGKVFPTEEDVPYKHRETISVFTEDDRSTDPDVFQEDEVAFCRHCRHYIVNPFTQYCGVHRKEVEATETCNRFETRPDTPPDEDEDAFIPPPKPPNPLLD